MERRTRPRNKSKPRKEKVARSPIGKPKKANNVKTKSPDPPVRRSRGRPPKKPLPSSEDSESRSRSRSRSESKSRRNHIKQGPSSRKEGTSRTRASSQRDDDELLRSVGGRQLTIPIYNDVSTAIRRSLSRDIVNDVSYSSKTETTYARRSETIDRVGNAIAEDDETEEKIDFGGAWGVFAQLVIVTTIILVTLLGCTKQQCEIKPFHIPRNVNVYFNLHALAVIVVFIIMQALLAILPIGRVVKSGVGGVSYRANGFLAMILTGAVLGGLWYQGYPVTRIYEWFIPAAVQTYLLAVIIALFLYIKARRARLFALNLYGNSGNFLYDFYMGRELNPLIFNINLKIVLLRFCVIGTIVIDGLLTLKAYEVRKQLSPTLATLFGLKFFYLLDTLWFEDLFSSTFESQYEGVGLMAATGLLMWPFFTAVLTRFVLTHAVEVPSYHLIASGLLFVVGFFIYRASNLQKATFRANPSASTLAHLKTIKTNRGRKLLVAGWWGWVKHPNYLGDIILSWATASVIGFSHALPYVVPLVTTVFLLHRAKRVDRRCRALYGEAWEEYSEQVPYLILPRIY